MLTQPQPLTKLDLSKFYFGMFAQAELAGIPCFVTRTGYTGEDGFEISVPNERALELTERLMAFDGVQLTGARDVARAALVSPCNQDWARATACVWRLGCAFTAMTWTRASALWRLDWHGPSVCHLL